jgi:hypothetical protein
MAIQLEGDIGGGAGLAAVDFRAFMAVARDARDLRILEDAAIKIDCVFGLMIEPQAAREAFEVLHGASPSYAALVTGNGSRQASSSLSWSRQRRISGNSFSGICAFSA